MPFWPSLALSSLSGVMLMLSFPNIFFPGFSSWSGALAFAGLIPYILVWKKNPPLRAALFGALTGLIYTTGMLYWIQAVEKDNFAGQAVSLFLFLLFGMGPMFFFSLTAKLVAEKFSLPARLILPLSWVAWEYVRGHAFLGGLPWASLGHTQYANPVVRQIAAVAGVGGISFIIVAVNVLLADWLQRIFSKVPPSEKGARGICLNEQKVVFQGNPSAGENKSLRLPFPKGEKTAHALAVHLLSPGLFGLGIILLFICVLEAVQFSRVKTQPMTLALLQGNINTNQPWTEEYKQNALQVMQSLQAEAARQKPDLMVWAESCFPGILEYAPEKKWEVQLRSLIKNAGIPTVLTSNEYTRAYELDLAQKYHHYNSAFFLSSQGETLGRYRKIKLVPFGEYVPWGFLKPCLRSVVQEPLGLDFEPGREYTVFQHQGARFAVLICYEDHFEEMGYQFARRKARLFLNLANDSWGQGSPMASQHTAMSAFLSVEHRAWMVKTNMCGPTLAIDPWGRMTRPLTRFQAGVKAEKIQVSEFKTFFTRFGNVVPLGLAILFFGLLLAPRPRDWNMVGVNP